MATFAGYRRAVIHETAPQRTDDLPNVHRGSSPVHGDGVFASVDLRAGDIVEVCPVLVVAAPDVEAFNTTGLDHYCYAWVDGAVALALGLGSLYNHSFTPNASFQTDAEANTVTIIALTDIARGDEVTFNYLGDSTDRAALWFDLSEETD